MGIKTDSNSIPLGIKITYIPFLILLIFKIGHSNSADITNLGYIVFFIWFYICFIFNPKEVINVLRKKHYVILYIFLLYHFIIGITANGVWVATKSTGVFVQYLSPMFMYEFYSRFENKKFNSINLMLITGILVYFSVSTIFYLNIDPFFARDIFSSGVDEEVIVGGGYALSYGLTLIVPALLYYFIVIIRKRNKRFFLRDKVKVKYLYLLVLLITMLIFSYVILKSMFMISILITIFGFLCAIVLSLSNKITDKYLFWIMIFLSILFLLTNELIFQFIESLLTDDHDLIKLKLLAMRSSFEVGVDPYDSLGGRVTLYINSLKIFLDNFFFGIGYQYKLDYLLMRDAGLGQHTEWFDILAVYGIFSVFLIWFIISWGKNIYSQKVGFRISFLCLLIVGFLNPIHLFTLFFATFYFIPTIDDHFNMMSVLHQRN